MTKTVSVQRNTTQSKMPRLGRNVRVNTPDGPGKIAGMNVRKNTNNGPGNRQYVVQLDDGRIRHYGRNEIVKA